MIGKNKDFKLFKTRKIEITTGLGIVLISGITILTNTEILELFDKREFGIFITEEKKRFRLDLK